MSSVLYRLGLWVAQHRAVVILAWIAGLVVAGLLALGLGGKTDDTFKIPGSPSQVALDQLKHTFPATAGSSAQIVVRRTDGSVSTPEVSKPVAAALPKIDAIGQVATILSPYDDRLKGQIADSDRALVINVPLTADSLNVTEDTRTQIRGEADRLQRALPAGTDVFVGGPAFNNVLPKLSLIEALGLVVALFALLALFRSLLASILPLLTALIGVGVAMALIYAMASVTTVSSTAPMLALMLGLAVAIDYALLILSRHRDQLRAGHGVVDSVARSVATAGSAVVFAGLTVIIALLGLGVVRIPFLTMMGVGAALAVAVALGVALTLLPAALALAGERLRPRSAAVGPPPREGTGPQNDHEGHPTPDHLTPDHHTQENDEVAVYGVPSAPGAGFFAGWARAVTRRPWISIGAVALAVLAMAWPGMPALHLPDNGAAPKTSSARQTYDVINEEFGPGYNGPLIVTADIVANTDPLGVMRKLSDDVSAMPGVKLVALSTPNERADTGILQVVPTTGPHDPATADLVERLRGEADTWVDRYGVRTAVTGFTAVAIDVSSQLAASLVPFGVVVVGLCLVLLTLVFRSIAVPIKATLGYLFSLAAAFGLTALVFDKGVGASFFAVQQTGGVISFLPIILMGVLFGLAMDYEVFLVSRMSEEYVHGADAHTAIIKGFTASAPVVTAAAVIMVSVFAAFVPAENANIKPIAFSLAVGVFVDAFIVRMVLVPAVMELLGDRAWWLPQSWAKRLPSLDIEGERVVHELDLANWPAPGSPETVSVAHLQALGRAGTVIAELDDLHLVPGQVGILGASAPAGCALAYALSGRHSLLSGDAKVAGLVLPQRARTVRRQVALVDYAEPGALELTESAVADAVPVLVLCHPEEVHDPGAQDRLRDAFATYLTDGTIVAVSRYPQVVASLFPDSAVTVVEDGVRARHPDEPDALGEVRATARVDTEVMS